ncbi:PREDICTED: uncharacterized protein LOC103081748 [Lipotes vexillifer]|uniref:Uncharacterized protein LOC103081748 n=1 Tax=Lipotes vexillifer TaxID=118797 RepID=A0A340YAY7_LIPVE|nr:PREDICTED: uncharacterized protein LOC103081748 [Lipotes vexillifer]
MLPTSPSASDQVRFVLGTLVYLDTVVPRGPLEVRVRVMAGMLSQQLGGADIPKGDPDYPPHVYAEEGKCERVETRSSLTFSEHDLSPDLLDSLGPKPAPLEEIYSESGASWDGPASVCDQVVFLLWPPVPHTAPQVALGKYAPSWLVCLPSPLQASLLGDSLELEEPLVPLLPQDNQTAQRLLSWPSLTWNLEQRECGRCKSRSDAPRPGKVLTLGSRQGQAVL